MKIPLSWIKEYIPIDLSASEVAHQLTMAGIETSAETSQGQQWNGVFVGKVIEVSSHPNADRLRLVTVAIASSEDAASLNTVVCGAPNVAEGQKIAFATSGAELIHPQTGKITTLKPAKIRGVESAGMVCSDLELGLGTDHDGIKVLPDSAPVGSLLRDYLTDPILEVEITPNRPDCLSVLGIARELSAITKTELSSPKLTGSIEKTGLPTLDNITISDPENCLRYTAALMKNIKVGPSPGWLQERLIKAGQRPINNIVDITNYVMLEYGQPLHAFDFEQVRGKHITVRQAFKEETFGALDGQKLTLFPPMLVIADDEGAIGLAGIIGGTSSEVRNETSTILLEAATFDDYNNRLTSGTLKLRTEASNRFAKGLSPALAAKGLQRAIDLIAQCCHGSSLEAVGDQRSASVSLIPIEISLSSKKIARVLGIGYTLNQTKDTLSLLGCEVTQTSSGKNFDLNVKIPYWRTDLTIENDLIEELARITGYDSIPTVLPSATIPYPLTQPLHQIRERIKDLMVATGAQEIVSYSLVSEKILRKVFSFDDSMPPLRLANPMSSEQEYLRNTLRGSILENLCRNQRYQAKGLRLFEIGRTYHRRQSDLPEEKEVLIAIVAGPAFQKSWLDEKVKDSGLGFFDAKGIAEFVLSELGLPTSYFVTEDRLFETGKAASILSNKKNIGIVGELKQATLDLFDIDISNVAMIELDIKAILNLTNLKQRAYRPLSKFPEALRDLALLVNISVAADTISNLINQHKLVTRVELFDMYQGQGSDHNKKSLAFHVTYQSFNSTLSAEEINRAQDQILAVLADKTGAELRKQ